MISCSFYELKLYFGRIWLIIIQSLQDIKIINCAIIDTWREFLMSGQNEHFGGIFHTNKVLLCTFYKLILDEVIFCSFYKLKLNFWRIWLIIIQSLKAIWIINYAIIDIWRELLMSGQIVHFWGIFHTNEVIFCSLLWIEIKFLENLADNNSITEGHLNN